MKQEHLHNIQSMENDCLWIAERIADLTEKGVPCEALTRNLESKIEEMHFYTRKVIGTKEAVNKPDYAGRWKLLQKFGLKI